MAEHVQAHMVVADDQGNIFDDPYLLMVGRRGSQWGTPRPDELIPLPPESELFLLPGRRAVGLDPETGETVETDDLAVGALAGAGFPRCAAPRVKTPPAPPQFPKNYPKTPPSP